MSFESAELDCKEITNSLGRCTRGVGQRPDCPLRSGCFPVVVAIRTHDATSLIPSSRGRWEFAALPELAPELLQSIEESLPARFNRTPAHDVPPLTHGCAYPLPIEGDARTVCAIFRDAAETSDVKGVLTPMYGPSCRKVREAFAVDVEWGESGSFGLSGLTRRATAARSSPPDTQLR